MELFDLLKKLNFTIIATDFDSIGTNYLIWTLSTDCHHTDEFYNVLKYLADNNLMSSEIEYGLSSYFGFDVVTYENLVITFRNDETTVRKITEKLMTLLPNVLAPNKSLSTFKF